jgi:pimeloyl-ACP methyl ester carboxylesterase
MLKDKLKAALIINLILSTIVLAQEPDFQKGYAPVNGISMYYEIYGTGNPLVLIHGGGSTIQTSFGNIIPSLSKKYKVIAVELQAHGHTSDRNVPESFEQDADDVAELLNQLHIDSAYILGFSNGGNSAMQLALRHPEKVLKLILASTFYKREGLSPEFWKGMDNANFNYMPQIYKDAFLKINNDQKALINMFNKDSNRMKKFKDWSEDDIKSIQAPALIVIGDRDIIRPEHAVEMYRLLPHAHLIILPGGHGEYLGEIMSSQKNNFKSDVITSLIEDFIESE